MKYTLKAALAASAVALCGAGAANAAIVLNFGPTATSSNTPATGASALVTMEFSDVVDGTQIDFTFTNTTGTPLFGANATQSTLTGFAFDLVDPATYVAGSFSSSAPVGVGALDTLLFDVNAAPFGTIDVGIADNNNYQGGNPNQGDGPKAGESAFASIVFNTTPNSAAQYEAAYLLALLSGDITVATRFQQVNAGEGSDKLTNPLITTTVVEGQVPLPASALLLLGGIGGLGALRAARRKAA